MTAGRFAIERWLTNQKFYPVDIILNVSPFPYVNLGMNSRPVGGRSSEI
jgi:hypothetical protein